MTGHASPSLWDSGINLGVFGDEALTDTAEALGHSVMIRPEKLPFHSSGHAVESRLSQGNSLAHRVAPCDVLMDRNGAGMLLVTGPGGMSDLRLLHEATGKPLVSYFSEPLTSAFEGVAWQNVWQCLQSKTWIKAFTDRAQVEELRRFDVANVMHLPPAAPDRVYDTAPLESATCEPIVSFVGDAAAAGFPDNAGLTLGEVFHASLAQAVGYALGPISFFDLYHDLYGFGEPIQTHDEPEVRVRKTLAYYQTKLAVQKARGLHQRDRFVLFLHRKLREAFHLQGYGWEQAYGIRSLPIASTSIERERHIRSVAIHVNFNSGDDETGLNPRHFEITASGGFMLCADQPELHECFEVGSECDVFSNEADLLDKISHYLAHPEERARMALAGQRRTLGQHLYRHRLGALLESVRAQGVRTLPVRFSATRYVDDFVKCIPDPDVILDCGANVGQMAAALRELYPSAEIYSFEPVSTAFDPLCQRCAELNVHPVRRAVGDFNGRATIHLTTGAEAHSLLGFLEGNPCARWTRVVGEEDVEVCTLDDWCEQAGVDPRRVDFIKLDIQGAELKALRGAARLLETARAVYTEVSFVPLYKDTALFQEIENFMTAHGYERYGLYPSDQPWNWGDALYLKKRPRIPHGFRSTHAGLAPLVATPRHPIVTKSPAPRLVTTAAAPSGRRA